MNNIFYIITEYEDDIDKKNALKIIWQKDCSTVLGLLLRPYPIIIVYVDTTFHWPNLEINMAITYFKIMSKNFVFREYETCLVCFITRQFVKL